MKYLILSCVLLVLLVISFWLLKKKSNVFYFNKTTINNLQKKSPITDEMYFFLKQLAKNGSVDNTILLLYYKGQSNKSIDCIVKKKNKMTASLFNIQNEVFSKDLIKKIRHSNDHRHVKYVINKPFKLIEES